MIIALCDRFKKLPSEVEAEDGVLLQYLTLVHLSSGDAGSWPAELEGGDIG